MGDAATPVSRMARLGAVAMLAALCALSAGEARAQTPADLPPPAAPSAAAPAESAEQDVLEPPRPLGGTQTQPAGALRLSRADRDLLASGPIHSGQWVLGGILGTWMGFGTGHIAQGRFSDEGLFFMAGEALALTTMVVSVAQATGSSRSCDEFGCRDGLVSEEAWIALAFTSVGVFGVLRIWEIIDVWYGPSRHNDAYQRVRSRSSGAAWGFFVAPTPGGAAMQAALRF